MAIYHMRVKTLSRSKGNSSVAAAAYRAALLLFDDKTGIKHDYRVRSGVVETQFVLPEGAALWGRIPQQLWNAAEAAERRKDAAVAREFEVALPHELNELQRSALVRELTERLVTRYGFAAQACIHAPTAPGGLNHHVHILATTRRMGPDGLTEKTRELDGRPGCTEQVMWVRAMVCDVINRHLTMARVDARVDHRTLSAQAEEAWGNGDAGKAIELTREPTKHIGKEAMALYRRGFEVEAVEENKAIRRNNQQEALVRLMDWRRASRGTDATLPNRLLASASGGIVAHLDDEDRARLALLAPDPATGSPHAAAAALLVEAEKLWNEPFRAWFDKILVMTGRFLKHSAERLRAYHERPQFLLHLKNLVWRLRQLKKDSAEGERRQLVLTEAIAAVDQAETALEQMGKERPRSGPWAKREWRRRRRAQAFELKVKRRAYFVASQEAAADTLEECEELASTSAQELEAWSRMLMKRYPAPQDAVDQRAANAAALGVAVPSPVLVVGGGDSGSAPRQGLGTVSTLTPKRPRPPR